MGRVCPHCQKTLIRIRRKPWMHRIPGSKRYVCRHCNYTYLLVLNRWLLKGRRLSAAQGNGTGA
jgi:transposase-like protein